MKMDTIKEARYNLGIAYLDDAQYKEAISEFDAIIKMDSEFIDAHCGLCRAYLGLNELDNAEDTAKTAIALNSDYAPAISLIDEITNGHYNNGITNLNNQRYYDAVTTFQKVTSLKSDYKEVNYYLGRTYIELKQFDNAISFLQSALDSGKAMNDVHYHLGRVYVEQREFDKAIHHLEQSIQYDPNLKEAHYNLAHAYRETGNLEAATNAANETLRLDSNYQPIHNLVEGIKQTHYNKGIAYLKDERYSDAVASFQNVITLDSGYTAAQFNLGIAYLKLENYSRAVDVLQKTISLDRTHKAAYHALALAHFGQHELEKARNAAKEALDIDPNYQPVRSFLEAIDPTFTHLTIPNTKEPDDAIKSTDIDDTGEKTQTADEIIEEIDEDNPIEKDTQPTQKTTNPQKTSDENPDISKELYRGKIYLNSSQYNQAVDAFKRIIKTDPNCIDAYYGLGKAYLESGAFDDAKAAAEAALQLNPQHQPSRELLRGIKYIENLNRKQKKRRKIVIVGLIVLLTAFAAFAAYSFVIIPFMKQSKPRENGPITPKLSVNSKLVEQSGNGFIDAGEEAQLILTVSNKGSIAKNVKIMLNSMSFKGLEFDLSENRYDIKTNKIIRIPITADRNLKGYRKTLDVDMLDNKGKTLAETSISIVTQPKVPGPDPQR